MFPLRDEKRPDPRDAVDHVASDDNGLPAYADCRLENSRNPLRPHRGLRCASHGAEGSLPRPESCDKRTEVVCGLSKNVVQRVRRDPAGNREGRLNRQAATERTGSKTTCRRDRCADGHACRLLPKPTRGQGASELRPIAEAGRAV